MTEPSLIERSEIPARRDGLPEFALGFDGVRPVLYGPEGPRVVSLPEVREVWGREPLLVANAPLMRTRLFGDRPFREARHFDVLELFAFMRPARFCAPSAAGLALSCGLGEPHGPEAQALTLWQATETLLAELEGAPLGFRLVARSGLSAMAEHGWPWAQAGLGVVDATGIPADYAPPPVLEVWTLLEEWEDQPPEGPARSVPLSEAEVQARLSGSLERAGLDERRPQQEAFAQAAREIFGPKWVMDQPNMLLAEAGTGTGKTLGYLAPAMAWAEKAQGQVWVSTYTRALQKQIWNDTRALFASEAERGESVAVRKGRENYLCLLNFQERVAGLATQAERIMAVLMARWALYSRDGDIISGDFPTWLPQLLPLGTPAHVFQTLHPQALVDRRGECVFAACPHYRVCYIEKSVRQSRQARLVIANHALVMAQAAYDLRDAAREAPSGGEAGADEEAPVPPLSRLIFDEGHHVFEAADSAFGVRLSGLEAWELRRWIRGAEGRTRRARGLEARLGELTGEGEAKDALREVLRAAAALPAEGFSQRISARTASGGSLSPVGPVEALLVAVLQQVELRAGEGRSGRAPVDAEQGGECEAWPATEAVAEAAQTAAKALAAIEAPMLALVRHLEDRLGDPESGLETAERIRLDGVLRGLERRARMLLPAWRGLLHQLCSADPEAQARDEAFVDWFSTEARRGQVVDVALNRHFVDPSLPLADYVLKPAHGVLVASATLTDGAAEAADDEVFRLARMRTGADHLVMGAKTARIASPFDYGAQARLFVITDLVRDDPRSMASAMQSLFLAARGGGLGLFTAIRRLRAVYEHLRRPLAEAGLPLYAQHVDPLDVSDLISVFRAEHHSCLLGTDAVRDGIDVPGQALRLIAFDRVPWPRPDCLHRARRAHFGQKLYDDALARGRLAQAFGRLIRKADDRGVFVMLDSAAPTRLFASLPPGIVVQRVTLVAAISAIEAFLYPP